MACRLPENAHRRLKKGEEYVPIVPADVKLPEITPWSVSIGVLMVLIFSASAAFLGLKVGTVFEAAIPIAVLAVIFSGIANKFTSRKHKILENVIIQSIGAASGVVVAGAIFTIPAIFILNAADILSPTFGGKVLKISIAAFIGGSLGILFLIPFRRFFVKEMHGEFPFPEARATTEILVAGEGGIKQSMVILEAMAVGGVLDFLTSSVRLWPEVFSSKVIPGLKSIASEFKMVLKIDVMASVAGLGYIVGVKYAMMIVAGSFVSWYLLIPIIAYIAPYVHAVIPPASPSVSHILAFQDEEFIFSNYVRYIGIGGIAMAGILGIIRFRHIIADAVRVAFRRRKGTEAHVEKRPRTDQDMSMRTIVILIGIFTILMFFFFLWLFNVNAVKQVTSPWTASIIAWVLVVLIGFLFTAVAANAIAIIGTNPVSGMTLMTLILISFFLALLGLRGAEGMVVTLIAGGVVCTALSTSGGFITDLKIGYWIGNTPKYQERFKFLGVFLASISVAVVLIILAKSQGFVKTPETPYPLAAPQANAMAAVIKTIMGGEAFIPWLLYLVGIIIALVVEMLGISSLAFALGMYIPLEYNIPILLGSIVGALVTRSAYKTFIKKYRTNLKQYLNDLASPEGAEHEKVSETEIRELKHDKIALLEHYLNAKKADDIKVLEKLKFMRYQKGVLISSGLIAGGAFMGVIGSTLKFFKVDLGSGPHELIGYGLGPHLIALLVLTAILLYMYFRSISVSEKEARAELESEEKGETTKCY